MIKPPKLNLAASFYLCVFYCLIFSAHANGQYRIENWSTEQGLPYKAVRSVLQTRDGYIWAATADGLARFDGVKFTVFNTANTTGLVTNSLGTLVEGNDGSLWIAADKRALIRFQNGVFTNYSTANGLPSDWILSLQNFPAENLLRVGTSEGFACFDGEKFIQCTTSPISLEDYKKSIVDNTGEIWQRVGNELRPIEIKNTKTLHIPDFFSKSKFNLLYRDRLGNYWLAMDDVIDGYVVRFHDDSADILSTKDGLPSGIISVIFEDSSGHIWFGSKALGGISIYKDGNFKHLAKKDGLSSDGFTDFKEDSEGGIWAATADGGLMRFSQQIITSFSSNDGLSGKGIYPLYEDRGGMVWIGDWGSAKGLSKYENGKFSTVNGGALYTSLFQDRNGAIWVGSYNQIGKIENGNFSVEFMLPEKATSAIIQDTQGAIWFGSGDGLRRMKSLQNSYTKPQPLFPNPDHLFDYFTVKNGLPGDDIKVLHSDANGILWIGTTGGLAKFENEKITAFTEKDGLSGNHIRSIYEDADGVLWFGTYDNGLTRLKDGKFTAIRVKDGLFDQGVFQILEDDFNRFWISSNRGIYRINKQELNEFADGRRQSITSIGYGAKDGMADAECNGGTSPAGFKSKKDGRLWFSTQKGVAVIDPKILPINSNPPNIAIEYCLLDGKETACDNITILPENDSLEIKYTGLSFNKPDQLKFKYKLEGLDTNWIDAGTRRRAFFTHLPPGTYSFKVSAANVDGVWNEIGASLQITVKPPFYRTWYFLALSLISFTVIVYFIFKRRTDFLRQRATEQEEFSRQLIESQELERQRIAIELHDSLGQDLLIIKNWAMLALNQNGDAKKTNKQLTEISETASQAIEEVREIAYNLRPYHLDELGLTKAIESMCQRVSQASSIDLDCLIDKVEGFFPKNEEINFYRIVQECLNNIVKHSGATNAKISVNCNSQNLHLEIEDNGQGFDVQETKTYLQNGKRRSLGLVSLIERSRILGGKIVIESIQHQGTKITLNLHKNLEIKN